MYLKRDKRKNGRIYLSIAQSYRSAQGKQTTRVVRNLGYLDDLEKQWGEDALAKCEAIRDRMTQEHLEQTQPQTLTIDPTELLDKDKQYRKNIGVCVPLAYYNALGIEHAIRNACKNRKFKFDCNAVMRLLVADRLFDQKSKLSAWSNKDKWFFRSAFSEDDTYRALDALADAKQKILAAINSSIKRAGMRDLSAVFYDVTNYYFEIDEEDALRRRGVSKEHRKSPIVQMGLLQDKNSLPITYRLFSGSTQDSQTLVPVLENLKRDYKLERVVCVADKGLNCSQNIAASVAKGDGFVFSQSVRGTKSDSELRKWVLDDSGYTKTQDQEFKIKSKQGHKTIHLKAQDAEDGRARDVDIEVKYVAFWSKKYATRARHEREKVLERARDLIKTPGAYTRATSYGAASFVKNISFDKQTGEVVCGRKLSLDTEAIARAEALDGYYVIVTSEIAWSDEKILDTYRELWRIEESFKVTKSQLKTRPVHVWTQKHIEAHFLVCYVALCIARLMQNAARHKHSIQTMLEELGKVNCSSVGGNLWLFDYTSVVVDDMFALIGKGAPKRWGQTAQIKSLLNKSVKPIMEIV